MKRVCHIVITVMVLAGFVCGAFAQSEETKGVEQTSEAAKSAAAGKTTTVQEMVDFRSMLMIAFAVVFVLLIGYLIMSHRKNAQLAEEVDFLKKRIEA